MTHKNSVLDAGWLAATMAQCPPTILANGDLRTGPVRLAFTNGLAEPIAQDSKRPDDKKFSTSILFPRGTDMGPYQQAALKAAQSEWPNLDQAGGPVSAALEWPFNDQAKKAQHEPFEAGNIFMTVKANPDRRPLYVDLRGAPIPNVKEKFYSGAWVLAVLNPYAWTYEKMKRGVSFGMSALIWLADDTAAAGNGLDVSAAIGDLGGLAPPPGQLSGFGGADPSAMFTTTAAPSPFAPPAAPSPFPPLPPLPAAVFVPPAPPPPPARPVLLNGGDYDAHILAGWTDATLRQHGMMA